MSMFDGPDNGFQMGSYGIIRWSKFEMGIEKFLGTLTPEERVRWHPYYAAMMKKFPWPPTEESVSTAEDYLAKSLKKVRKELRLA